MYDEPYLTMTGNTTADPELRFTPSGKAVANFTVAHTPQRKDGDKWVDGDPLFVRVSCWNQLAEHVAESFKKGHRVTVRGALYARNWETDQGEKRTSIEMTADDVAASVKYATVDVKKAARSGANTGPATDPWTGEAATLTERPA